MMTDKSTSNKAEVSTSVSIKDNSEVKGTVRIAPTVLIQLIEKTVQNIDGVANITSRKGKKRDEEIAGKSFDNGRTLVVVDGDRIDADIAITLKSHANVSKVTDEIRREIGLAAGRMLGMTMRSVDIYVDNVEISEP